MNDWIKEILVERYGMLVEKSEKKREYVSIRERVHVIEKLWIGQLSEQDKKLLVEWQELNNQLTSIQREWLYVKGVQDGLQLLIFLLFNEDALEPSN